MSTDFDNDLLLVTCASGKQCSHLLPRLTEKWKRLRLVVNSESSEKRTKEQYPTAEVTRADLSQQQEARRIMNGVTAVYHVGPSFHPHETEIGYNMIDAASQEAETGSFKHFVLSSVLNTQYRKMMNHDGKRYIEEYLMESALNFTILQPTHFMDVFPLGMLMQQEEPVYRVRWKPSNHFSFIALKDLGEAAAKVLNEREAHYLAQYPLSSTRALSYSEVVDIASKEIGKAIRIEQLPFEEAVNSLCKMLFGSENPHPRSKDSAGRMILFYNFHGLAGNPNVLEWLLGRKPTSHAEWIRQQIWARQ